MRCLVFIFLLSVQFSFGQEIATLSLSNKVERIIKQIAKDGVYKGSAVGYSGVETDQ